MLFRSTSINELEFELDSIDWYILNQANNQVISYVELIEGIRANFDINIMDLEIMNTIEDLKLEGLLYVAEDYSEIVSIINTAIMS